MTEGRREFLGKLGLGLGAFPFFSDSAIAAIRDAGERENQDAFWYQVQKAYKQSPKFINLENGYFSPQPEDTLNAHIEYQRRINEIPSWFMRRMQAEEKDIVKEQLADFAGVGPGEIVVTRNTTESLNTVILGLKMEKGDEAVFSDQEYGSMKEAFRMRARREGIVNREIQVPVWPESDDEIVGTYERAITKRTRVLLVSQVINISGQVLPVRKIADMAHSYGVDVICDSAHAFAHLDYTIPDLGCDYCGASLHKWLCTPLGAGLLYVKKDKISDVWPLFGDDSRGEDDISKFEHIGTHPVHTNQAISNALKFHNAIGSRRKQERLLDLREYWTDKVKDLPKVTLNMPLERKRASAIGNIAIEGYTGAQLSDYLLEEHNIWTVAINRKAIKGVRVTPHLYTTFEDLDKFVKAVKKA